MDYSPAWKVKNGHIQGEMYENIPYMDPMALWVWVVIFMWSHIAISKIEAPFEYEE